MKRGDKTESNFSEIDMQDRLHCDVAGKQGLAISREKIQTDLLRGANEPGIPQCGSVSQDVDELRAILEKSPELRSALHKLLSSDLSRPNGGRTRRRARLQTQEAIHKKRVIWRAIRNGLSGPAYCRLLSFEGLKCPWAHPDHSEPVTYEEAYRNPLLARRIIREKAYFKKKMPKPSAS